MIYLLYKEAAGPAQPQNLAWAPHFTRAQKQARGRPKRSVFAFEQVLLISPCLNDRSGRPAPLRTQPTARIIFLPWSLRSICTGHFHNKIVKQFRASPGSPAIIAIFFDVSISSVQVFLCFFLNLFVYIVYCVTLFLGFIVLYLSMTHKFNFFYVFLFPCLYFWGKIKKKIDKKCKQAKLAQCLFLLSRLPTLILYFQLIIFLFKNKLLELDYF